MGQIAYIRDDGAIAIRASAGGACLRALWAAAVGVERSEPGEHVMRAAEEGNLHEEAMRKAYSEKGIEITGDQQKVELWVIPKKVVFVGHIDGEVDYHGHRLWEGKSMSRKVFDRWIDARWESQPKYAWQISIYMLAKGYPDDLDGVLYSAKRRDDGLIDEMMFDEPPISLNEMRKKALALWKAVNSHEMPACSFPPEDRWPCDYFFLHDEDEAPGDGLEDPAPDGFPELNEMLGHYYELSNVIGQATKERKELKERLEEFRDGRTSFGSDYFVVAISKRQKASFDKSKMIVEQGEELVRQYEGTTPYEVWSVKPREGVDDAL